MLKFVVLSILFVATLSQDAGRYVRPRVYRQPVRYTGDERINYIDETPKPYSFSYAAPADEGIGSSSRTETADGNGRVQGSYTLTNDEGHTRYVEYIADEAGFRAVIRTDEPGTANQSPADVTLQSGAPLPYAANVDRSAYRPIVRSRARVPVVAAVEEVEQPIAEEPVVNVAPRRHVPNYARRAPYYAPHY